MRLLTQVSLIAYISQLKSAGHGPKGTGTLMLTMAHVNRKGLQISGRMKQKLLAFPYPASYTRPKINLNHIVRRRRRHTNAQVTMTSPFAFVLEETVGRKAALICVILSRD